MLIIKNKTMLKNEINENEALSIARVSKSVMVSELRIGNLVKVDNQKYHPKLKDVFLEVTEVNESIGIDLKNSHGIGLKHINQKPYTYYERYSQLICFIKPIPLSEKWLEKLGFSVITENSAGKRYGYVVNGIHSSDLTFTFWKTTKDAGKFFRCDLELTSVHQIQNLYFALTGRELTVC